MLQAGSRLGVYEIVSALGAGGMGEVYRARDTRLGRDVAIKILPASVVGDPERIARFQREAQLLAALNHPHIAAIYGFEEAASTPFLVLEFVEGGTLSDRLQGLGAGGLGLDEALTIARQIAEALEAGATLGVARERSGERLERDVATQAHVARAVDLAHAAGAERLDDLVRAEARAGGEGHLVLPPWHPRPGTS